MAYINNVSTIVLVLFLAVAIDMRLAEAEPNPFSNMDPDCATAIPDLLEKCFATVRETPTVECCSDLKSATTKQVTCLCDNYIANPALINITGPYSAGITTQCGVSNKYSCDGTSKDGEEGSSSHNTTSTSNGSKTDHNGGATNKIAASMGVFGLVASLFFAMF